MGLGSNTGGSVACEFPGLVLAAGGGGWVLVHWMRDLGRPMASLGPLTGKAQSQGIQLQGPMERGWSLCLTPLVGRVGLKPVPARPRGPKAGASLLVGYSSFW